MKKILILALLVVSSFGYYNCTMCHYDLNKYTPQQIIEKLNAFKKSSRTTRMTMIVKNMSEADIKDAAYKYGKQ